MPRFSAGLVPLKTISNIPTFQSLQSTRGNGTFRHCSGNFGSCWMSNSTKKGNFGVANDIVDVTLLICGLLIVNLVLELDVLRPV